MISTKREFGTLADQPRRIVCLTPETADILYRLGVEDRVVGVSSLAPPAPSGKKKPVVSQFTTFRYQVIESLQPDLIIGFSDLQAEAASALGKKGYSVLLTNQRTLHGVLDVILLLARIVRKEERGRELAGKLQGRLEACRASVGQLDKRPTVYFEEWDEPLITGLGWIGELIEAVGGRDAFAELGDRPSATQRIIAPEEVARRNPDIIIASWCGRPVKLDAIASRVGWEGISAVKNSSIYEMPGICCLQPGPVLFTDALDRFREIITGK